MTGVVSRFILGVGGGDGGKRFHELSLPSGNASSHSSAMV